MKIFSCSRTYKIFYFFMFFIGPLFSDTNDYNFEGNLSLKDDILIVSLGSGCDTAITLRECGLRQAAFPFDWLITGNHQGFVKLFEEDFEFFTDERFFEPIDFPADRPNCLKQTYYDILFWHEETVRYDWADKEKYQEQMNRIHSKYARRINRFRDIRFFKGKVFFVRNFTSETQDQANQHSEMAIELRDTLRSYFPNIDLMLIIVTYKDVNAPAIENLEGIFEFRMERNLWKLEYENMYKILQVTDSHSR